MNDALNIVVLGLSITSTWRNGHAYTYRSLIHGLASRGHRILFLERDLPWHAANRDVFDVEGAAVALYESLEELMYTFEEPVKQADLVIVGSCLPEGCAVSDWVIQTARGKTAFYDFDTPLTLAKLSAGDNDYISEELIPRFNCYLSFAGGPTLRVLERHYKSPMARVLFSSVDPDKYLPSSTPPRWDLGYLGTYSDDRQPALDGLMLEAARWWPEGRFAVAGSMYPDSIDWPENVDRMEHLPQPMHAAFYASQRFTLNVPRDGVKASGYSPGVRLFEAAACGTPILSDWWDGLDCIFAIGKEILITGGPEETLRRLWDVSDTERMRLANAARNRVLAEHTQDARARQLEGYVKEMA